jgi:hypothetical protein
MSHHQKKLLPELVVVSTQDVTYRTCDTLCNYASRTKPSLSGDPFQPLSLNPAQIATLECKDSFET